MKKTLRTALHTFFYFPAKKSFIFFGTMLIVCTAFGQIQWTEAGTATTWYTATNWTPNTASGAWLTTDIAQFNNTGTAVTAGIDMGIAPLSVGAVEITSARTRNLTIGNNSVTNGTLTLNGTTVNAISNVILRNASANLLTLQDNETGTGKIMDIVLANVTDNVVNIDGTGGIAISSVISGAGRKLTLGGTGSGILTLSGTNTYTGLTTVSANTLQLNKTGGGTLPSTNDITLGGTGTLRISTNQTVNNLTLPAGTTLILDAGVTLTVNGTFFHNGGTITSAGTIVYGAGGTLSYGGTSAQTTTNDEFPALSAPANVTINNTAGVTLHASRTIASTLTLTAGNFILGTNNFTASVTAGSPSTSTHVVTNGTGKLYLTNIGASSKLFPVGGNTGTINAVIIYNGLNLDYGVRVENSLTSYPIADPNVAVNRTWFVSTASTPGAPVNINFFYAPGEANAGFNYTSNVNLGVYLPFGYGWNINGTYSPAGSYQVATTVSSFLGSFDFPMVIGNLGAVLAAPNRSIDLTAVKQNNQAKLSWILNTGTPIKDISIQRSADGRNFEPLATVAGNSSTYSDDKLLAGTNYYRIRATDINGRVFYSSIVAVISSDAGFDIISLLPNIVRNNMQLNIAAAQKNRMNVVITDLAGRPVTKVMYNLSAGSNVFDISTERLAAGMYWLTATTATGEIKTVRFVKQ